ncbi:MAG: hypothetical protein R2861_14025 [Desulfobacterales bacterium]
MAVNLKKARVLAKAAIRKGARWVILPNFYHGRRVLKMRHGGHPPRTGRPWIKRHPLPGPMMWP